MQAAVKKIQSCSTLRPTLAIILGSGFHATSQELRTVAQLPYTKIPGLPKPSVPGHHGELRLGHLGQTPVLVLSGRAHYYEGYDLAQVTFSIRLLAACGIRDVLLTNAAGGINRKFRAGDFMLVTDHINLMGVNPLRGKLSAGLNRFVDLTRTYDSELSAQLRAAARKVRLKLQQGVYLAVAGPSYETPAEIRAFARLGADAVGMSTVPEAIVARQLGLRVAALSCITNLAAGISSHPLSHHEVLETANRSGRTGARLLTEFAQRYANHQ